MCAHKCILRPSCTHFVFKDFNYLCTLLFEKQVSEKDAIYVENDLVMCGFLTEPEKPGKIIHPFTTKQNFFFPSNLIINLKIFNGTNSAIIIWAKVVALIQQILSRKKLTFYLTFALKIVKTNCFALISIGSQTIPSARCCAATYKKTMRSIWTIPGVDL